MRMRRRAGSDERGAMAVTIGLLFPMVLAISALSANHASMWTERRELVQATDAAALAGASTLSSGGSAAAVDAICREYLTRNHSAAAAASATCRIEDANAVRVTASAPAPIILMPAAFRGDSRVSATSLAQAGPAISVVGSRPMAICVRSKAYEEWLETRNSAKQHTIRANDPCPKSELVPPNQSHRTIEKAIFAADGGNNESNLRTLLTRGTDLERLLCEPLDTRENWTSSNRESVQAAVGTIFPTVVYGYSRSPLNEGEDCDRGSSTGRPTFPVVGFVGVELHSAQISGTNARFVVSFHDLDVSGRCCSSIDRPGAKVVRLCDPTRGCPAPTAP